MANNTNDEYRAKREKKANFSDEESIVLLHYVEQNYSIITQALKTGSACREKRSAWDRVANAVNARGGHGRSSSSMKKRWRDMVRDVVTKVKNGGKSGDPPAPYEQWILRILSQRQSRTENPQPDLQGVDTSVTESGACPSLQAERDPVFPQDVIEEQENHSFASQDVSKEFVDSVCSSQDMQCEQVPESIVLPLEVSQSLSSAPVQRVAATSTPSATGLPGRGPSCSSGPPRDDAQPPAPSVQSVARPSMVTSVMRKSKRKRREGQTHDSESEDEEVLMKKWFKSEISKNVTKEKLMQSEIAKNAAKERVMQLKEKKLLFEASRMSNKQLFSVPQFTGGNSNQLGRPDETSAERQEAEAPVDAEALAASAEIVLNEVTLEQFADSDADLQTGPESNSGEAWGEASREGKEENSEGLLPIIDSQTAAAYVKELVRYALASGLPTAADSLSDLKAEIHRQTLKAKTALPQTTDSSFIKSVKIEQPTSSSDED